MYHPFPLNRKPLTNYKLTPSTSNLALFSIEDLVIFQDSWQDEIENGAVQRIGGGLQFGFVRFRFVSFRSVPFRFVFVFAFVFVCMPTLIVRAQVMTTRSAWTGMQFLVTGIFCSLHLESFLLFKMI
jgi:hypothetical protein